MPVEADFFAGAADFAAGLAAVFEPAFEPPPDDFADVFEAAPEPPLDDFAAEDFEAELEELEDFAPEVFEPAPEPPVPVDLAAVVFEPDDLAAVAFDPPPEPDDLAVEPDDFAADVFDAEPPDDLPADEPVPAFEVVDFDELLVAVFEVALDDLLLEDDFVAAVFEPDDLLVGAAFVGAAFLVVVAFAVGFFVGIRFSPNWVNFSKSQSVP